MPARYTQGIAAFARITSKVLVNGDSNKVVNIASTKMMKKVFAEKRTGDDARLKFHRHGRACPGHPRLFFHMHLRRGCPGQARA
ncbi:MAG: hypothetical protein WDN50_23420 [Bradyrhizobium sp.]